MCVSGDTAVSHGDAVVPRVIPERALLRDPERCALECDELARLRLLVENSTDVVSTATNDGRLTWVSDSVTASLGWQPADLVGRFLGEFVHPDDYHLLVEGLPELQDGGAPRAEIRIRDHDGADHWISLLRRQVFDDAGRPAYRIGGWREVTAEHAVRAELAASHAFQRAVLDAMLDPYVLLTPVRDAAGDVCDFRFDDVNPAALAVYGMAREVLIGRSLIELHPAVTATGLLDRYREVLTTGDALLLDDWEYPADILGGELRRYDVRAVRVGDAVLQVWRDVTDRFEEARRLEHQAQHDGLTGTLNHGEAMRRLGSALHERRTTSGQLAVLFCDSDNFKEINDGFGHVVGDQVLVELAQRITATVRADDLVARVGGDEFLVVLHGIDALASAVQVAEGICRAAAVPVATASGDVRTSLSIGVALALPDESLDHLIERADVAMYAAKRAGRNRVHVL